MRKGIDTMLDFGRHEHSLFGNIKNVSAAYAICLLWTILIISFLRIVLSMTIDEIKGLLSTQILNTGVGAMTFRSIVLAPIWEEACFRGTILKMSIGLEQRDSGSLLDTNFVLPAMILSSIVFGLAHGGVLNILTQGVTGFVLSWVMMKSGYKWAVLTHAMWNFMLMFGLPVLMR